MADGELAARVRAAFAYKGLSKDERAAALGVSVRTVTRYESGKNPIDTQRLAAVAEATGVPESFLANGFPNGEEPAPAERLESLEHQLTAVWNELRTLRDTDGTLAANIRQLEQGLQAIRGTGRRRARPGANG